MRRLALIALIAIAFSGASCLHEAVAMEPTHSDVAMGLADGASSARMDECRHGASNGTVMSIDARTNEHGGSCCVERQATKTEADGGAAIHALSDLPVSRSSPFAFPDNGMVETRHPPDLRIPFHQRTTCQRE
jgi:hypothetical protein